VGPEPIRKPAESGSTKTFNAMISESNQELIRENYQKARGLVNDAMELPDSDKKEAAIVLTKIELAETLNLLRTAETNKNIPGMQKWASKLQSLDPFHPALTDYRRLLAELENQPEENLKKELTERIQTLKNAIRGKDWVLAQLEAEGIRTVDPQNNSLKKLPPEVYEIPAILQFYSGQYQKSIKALEKSLQQNKTSARVYFYLGCNNAALALLESKSEKGKDERERLVQRAIKQFVEARSLQTTIKVDRKFISPRILKLYDESQLARRGR